MCTASSTPIRSGRRSTWLTYIRDSSSPAPGNGAPQTRSARFPPITGTARRTEYAMARPMPERRSSTSE
jgi:hypothetical protein